MGRRAKGGGKAAQDALSFVDPFISHIVDLYATDLNPKQRYNLRVMILSYEEYGDRRRSKDTKVEADFEDIITMYIEPNENFRLCLTKPLFHSNRLSPLCR